MVLLQGISPPTTGTNQELRSEIFLPPDLANVGPLGRPAITSVSQTTVAYNQ